MIRLIIAILITLLLTSCKSRSQDKIDIPKSLNLFKDGCEVMKQGFTTEFDDSLAGQKFYRQAIIIFNASLMADPTNLRLGTYLSDLYYKEQKFDSALLWAQRLFPLDSVEYFKDNKVSISNSYSFIGSCFLYEGDIQNGNKFFRMALDIDTSQVLRLTQALSDIADKFYYKSLPNQIKKLKSKNIDACKYSLDIMELGLSIGGTEKFVKDFLFKKEKFTEREKTCR
jgi:tetratricopeptide (TPR) repeat protein